MGLSDLAKEYLASLPREKPVSCERVQQEIEKLDAPLFEIWLQFHQNYAGYVETIGNDYACWGLMHDDLRFSPPGMKPNSIDAHYDHHDTVWRIRCADAHPSYNFELDQHGELLNGPASSFDLYVEQSALYRHFCTSGDQPKSQFRFAQDDIARELEDNGAELIENASDQYQEYWIGKNILAVRDLQSSQWVRVVKN
jgi:hypothetical protein